MVLPGKWFETFVETRRQGPLFTLQEEAPPRQAASVLVADSKARTAAAALKRQAQEGNRDRRCPPAIAARHQPMDRRGVGNRNGNRIGRRRHRRRKGRVHRRLQRGHRNTEAVAIGLTDRLGVTTIGIGGAPILRSSMGCGMKFALGLCRLGLPAGLNEVLRPARVGNAGHNAEQPYQQHTGYPAAKLAAIAKHAA